MFAVRTGAGCGLCGVGKRRAGPGDHDRIETAVMAWSNRQTDGEAERGNDFLACLVTG